MPICYTGTKECDGCMRCYKEVPSASFCDIRDICIFNDNEKHLKDDLVLCENCFKEEGEE